MGMFTDIVLGMRQGAADRLASELLEKVGQAVLATRKKGYVNVRVGIEMLKDGENETKVTIDVTDKTPREQLPSGIYYVDGDGRLHRGDPRQLSMLQQQEKDNNDSKVSVIPRHSQL